MKTLIDEVEDLNRYNFYEHSYVRLDECLSLIRKHDALEKIHGIPVPIFSVHNAAAVFAGKNVAFCLEKRVADILVEYGNSKSKYESYVRSTVAYRVEYHDGLPHSLPTKKPDAELVDLRKDKERLDFLDMLNAGLNQRYGTTYGWEMITSHNVNRVFCEDLNTIDLNDAKAHGFKSCRDAIDHKLHELQLKKAALASLGQEEKKQ